MAKVISYHGDAPRCDFCGKTEQQVSKLVTGPGVAICDECIALCVQILAEDRQHADAGVASPPRPAQIFDYLNRYVIGQEPAKRTLSVAVYNHYKRIAMKLRREGAAADFEPDLLAAGAGADVPPGDAASPKDKNSMPPDGDVEIAKSNVLLIGPTGVGKTYLARNLAKVMRMPFVITDATTLTEAGYVGDDVETVLQRLLQAADGDVQRAQHGIVYIDEIDKIARKSGKNTSITRDVSGEGVQQALLKILEGTTATVPLDGTRRRHDQETAQIDTSDILFICGGAFAGLDDIIRRRTGAGSSGFGAPLRDRTAPEGALLRQVSADDLCEFGLLPEFVGRLPVISVLNELTLDDLRRVLVEPANALVRQYQELFRQDGVRLSFTDEAITAIARTAFDRGVGARGLRAIIEKTLEDAMFEIPGRHDVAGVIVSAEAVRGTTRPRYVAAEQASARRRTA